jgi:hypothetical protein
MTESDQLRALAEIEGRKCWACNGTGKHPQFDSHAWYAAQLKGATENPMVECEHCPRYGLDDLHRMEGKLTYKQWGKYCSLFTESLLHSNPTLAAKALLHATAERKRENMLRTYGRWKE